MASKTLSFFYGNFMGHRLSKIYTRTGDAGTTGLGDGSRVAKDDLRIQALGDIDELNAILGVLRAQIQQSKTPQQPDWEKSLSLIQHWLFDLGGEVCIPNYTLLQQARFATNHRLEITNQLRIRMWPCNCTNDIISTVDITDPVTHRFIKCIF